MLRPPRSRVRLTVGLIALVGACLRAITAFALLPYAHNSDEARHINAIWAMAHRHSIDTTVYSYPALFFNVEAVLSSIFTTVTGRGDAPVETSSLVAIHVTNVPLVVAMRALSIVASSLTIVLAALLARRISGRDGPAILAAALAALNPLDIRLGGTVTVDPLAGMLATAAVLGITGYVVRPTRWTLGATGAVFGLAVAAKYNVALLAPGFLVAVLVVKGRRAGPTLAGLCVASLAAFAIASPQVAADLPTYWAWFRGEQTHYRGGHPGYEGGALWYYLTTSWWMVGPMIAAIPVLTLLRRRSSRLCLPVSVSCIAYVGILSTYATRFDRNLLVLSGSLAALAAVGTATLARTVQFRQSLFALGAAALALPVVSAGRAVVHSVQDPWTSAREYIERSIPPGSSLAIESYGPWLPSGSYEIVPLAQAIDVPLDWFAETGIDYVVTTNEVRGRYDADRYPDEVLRYDLLFATTCLVETFESNVITIEVRSTDPDSLQCTGRR